MRIINTIQGYQIGKYYSKYGNIRLMNDNIINRNDLKAELKM